MMNPIKIEKGAIETLKRTIRLHDKMDELLQEDDKGPSWDGDIYLYTNSDLKAAHIQYTIPTQVKGKNDEKLLKRKSISYPIKYKNLRNYRNDGGVCYFVIVISNDGEKASIFYNALTPIKLESFLKGTEKKGPDQTKNIPLLRLKNNDKNELHKILLQFGFDRNEQGTGELVRKAISIEDIEKIDSIRSTPYAGNEYEAMKYVMSGEACLYGHLAEADIWVPFAYEMQKNMIITENRVINRPFGVDGINYYSQFVLQRDMNNIFTIKLSDNISLNTKTNKISFNPVTDLDTLVNDINFLRAMKTGKSLMVGKDLLATFDNAVFSNELCEADDFYINLKKAVDKFEINLQKNFQEFKEEDWEAVSKLVGLWEGQLIPKKEMEWYMWWWQGKVIPFFVAKSPEGEVIIENALRMQELKITLGEDGKNQIPAYVMFKRDIWEKLYDVEEEVLLEALEKSIFNEETEGRFSLVFVEILATYDLIRDEKYYDLAKLISDKLLEFNPTNDYWEVNNYQLLRRKRELFEEELLELEKIESRTEDSKLLCAVNILLENKRKAKSILQKMDDDDKNTFTAYPIYNLL